MKLLKKNKKAIIVLLVGVVLILSGFLSWNFYFSKYKIFHDYEKQFTEVVKRYYSMNTQYLPKKTETREMTLQDLYDGGHIHDLYIPKTNKLCDTNSWVRVYQNEDGTYGYNTYLKCGKFESNVDHIGPEITLNGDSEIILSLGSEYQEAGVKSVKDNKDGKMNDNSVIIDASKVDTNTIGTYEVTYTLRDKAYNKTVVKRIVTVAENLTEVVKNNTDDSNYYKGTNPNNYLLFSGMLWRIVNVNEDGSVKIVSYDNIANVSYGQEGEDFDHSNIKEWLNNYFYSKIHDTSYLKEDNTWCIDAVSNINSFSNCVNYSEKSPVGMLSLYDYIASDNNYFGSFGSFWIINRMDNNLGYTYASDKNFVTLSTNSLAGVKPVLVLRNNLYIISGNGTQNNPYTLGDYSVAKRGDLLNNRVIGEHVSYFDMTFRISDIDKDGNTKLTSVGYLYNNSTNNFLYASYDNASGIRKFNPKEEGNIAYQLNGDYLDYIDDKYIVKHSFNLPIYDSSKKYSQFETESFDAKISIPASYEMFSSTHANLSIPVNYWLLDYIDGNHAFMINNRNGGVFTIENNSLYKSNGFKLVFYVNSKIRINSGKGTENNPYTIY